MPYAKEAEEEGKGEDVDVVAASVDALSSAIFRLHEQVIPLSYLSSISGIINHFDDLHSTSPFRNMHWYAKLRYYSRMLEMLLRE